MDRKVDPADLSGVRTEPLARRAHKVSVDQFAGPVTDPAQLRPFLDGLPDLLAVRHLKGLAASVRRCREEKRPCYWALGGHVVKCGTGPVLIDLMERGFVSALVLNGATAIHDWEIAVCGQTSEDVDASLPGGTFGMADETGQEFHDAAVESVTNPGLGYGGTLGARLAEARPPHARQSLLASAARLGIPITIHMSVGCDVVHHHPAARGEALGAATHLDFRRLVTLVGDLNGGAWLNIGSAVQLPETFLKALSVARNLGADVQDIVTANLDMQRHYRTSENVLRRPVLGGGTSYELIGHHEINLPLLAAAIGNGSDTP